MKKNLTAFTGTFDDFSKKICRFLQESLRFLHENQSVFTGTFDNFSEKFGNFFKKMYRFLQENLTIFVEKSSGLYTNI